MTIITRVKEIQTPTITERFTVGKGAEKEIALAQVTTAANIYMANKLALAVLAKAYEICESKPIHLKDTSLHCISDKWNFVMCSPFIQNRLDSVALLSGNVHATHHIKFENKLVAFKLKDPTHALVYSFEEVVTTNPNVELEYELRLQINLDVEEGILYHGVV